VARQPLSGGGGGGRRARSWKIAAPSEQHGTAVRARRVAAAAQLRPAALRSRNLKFTGLTQNLGQL
jgi:hypothetical protein